MASHAECEKCFEAYVVISTVSGALVNTTALTLLLESFAENKNDSVASF